MERKHIYKKVVLVVVAPHLHVFCNTCFDDTSRLHTHRHAFSVICIVEMTINAILGDLKHDAIHFT